MSSILKACVYNVKIDHNNLFAKPFKETLKDLASMLDDVGGNGNIRILDTYKGKETSIWFDSFDYEKDFLEEAFATRPFGCDAGSHIRLRLRCPGGCGEQ